MTDKLARKLVQVSFLLVFLFPFVPLFFNRLSRTYTWGLLKQFPGAGYLLESLVEKEAPIYSGSWLLPFDPLLSLTQAFRQTAAVAPLALPLLLLALAFFGGRFFCGWVCPLGTLLDLIRPLAFWSWFQKKRYKRRRLGLLLPILSPQGNSYLRYFLLVAIVILSAFSLQFAGFFDPLVVFNRAVASVMSDFFMLDNLGFNLYFSFSVLVVAILIMELWRPRFWCRHLCPLGALLGLFSQFTLFNRKVGASCNRCRLCQLNCPMSAIPDDPRETNRRDCTLCLECQPVCPRKCVSFSFGNLALLGQPSPAGIGQEPQAQGGSGLARLGGLLVSRRQFVGAAVTGAATLALPGYLRPDPKVNLVRPPGALVEEEFVRTCIICQECVRVCPPQGLQPAFFEAGLKAMGTPYLAPRRGKPGGCELNRSCPHLCARVCPVGALQLIEKPDVPKKMKMGTARLDRSHCLAWEQGTGCRVCVEACPTGAAQSYLRRVVVDANLCSGCGICERVCPVVNSAIHVTTEGEKRFLPAGKGLAR